MTPATGGAGRGATGGRRGVDLRSDTVTRPSRGMRLAMAEAEVGDDVYGEDPTVLALEAQVAALFGHQAALFCPTGSMTNMLGVRLLVGPGEELLCDSLAHVVRAELGGHATFGQVTTRTWTTPRSRLDADLALAMATPDAGPYLVSTRAFAVEDTHNLGGGTVQPLAELERLRAGANAMGVAVHLDGARIWNAHIATGAPLMRYGALADTLSVCLSKGLGAPIGSLLVSSSERIATARVWRKRYGGGMRQVGVLAAAGRYALDHHLERLADDHRRAAELAAVLAEARPEAVDPEQVETNIVVVDLSGTGMTAPQFIAKAGGQGVAVGALGPHTIRLVTHLDLDEGDVAHAGAVLAELLKA